MKYYIKFIGMLFLIFIFIEMQGCSETDILYRENISEDSDIRQIQKENEKNKGTAIMSSHIKNYNNKEVMTPSSDAEGYIMHEDFGIFDLMHDTVSYNGITYYKWKKTFTKRNIEEQFGYFADGATDFALVYKIKEVDSNSCIAVYFGEKPYWCFYNSFDFPKETEECVASLESYKIIRDTSGQTGMIPINNEPDDENF